MGRPFFLSSHQEQGLGWRDLWPERDLTSFIIYKVASSLQVFPFFPVDSFLFFFFSFLFLARLT